LLGRGATTLPTPASESGEAIQPHVECRPRPPEVSPEDSSPTAAGCTGDKHVLNEGRLRTLELDVQVLRQMLHIPGVERLAGVRPSGSAEDARLAAWAECSSLQSGERSLLLGQLADAVGTPASAAAGDVASGLRRTAAAEPAASEPREREVADLIATLSIRATQLEQQLEGGAEGKEGADAGTPQLSATVRTARLECQVEALASALESLRQQRLQAATTLEERLRALEEAARTLQEEDVPGLQDELRRVRERLAKHAGRSSLPTKPVPELAKGIEVETDESKFKALRKEIASNAKAATSRMDSLERGLTRRVEKAEATTGKIDQIEHTMLRRVEKLEEGVARLHREGETKTLSELSKQCDWLQWRMSWLEWSADGEKRSFGRPLDDKAIPAPGRSAALSQSPVHPLTEDAELWAREPSGRQRPRRRLRTQQSPPRAPSVETGSPQERSSSIRATRSDSRLPTLKL